MKKIEINIQKIVHYMFDIMRHNFYYLFVKVQSSEQSTMERKAKYQSDMPCRNGTKCRWHAVGQCRFRHTSETEMKSEVKIVVKMTLVERELVIIRQLKSYVSASKSSTSGTSGKSGMSSISGKPNTHSTLSTLGTLSTSDKPNKPGDYSITAPELLPAILKFIRHAFEPLLQGKHLCENVTGIIMSYTASKAKYYECCAMPNCRVTVQVPDYTLVDPTYIYGLPNPVKYGIPVICDDHVRCTKCGGYCGQPKWTRPQLLELLNKRYITGCHESCSSGKGCRCLKKMYCIDYDD
ncbi:MAG: hypothetical protein Faunusvirus11_25 [Faunusvirus sp.]|jgi:hypothetical protein|uniref:Uncharacterized protein n=1 Tax=Faunusvirus sp. TaxID=2487766 RepID=A0A3G4ZWV6_9VIRU|nr:MAG: hypothetical protein Faunusvirus11_25 [Faunusvirus sp.]